MSQVPIPIKTPSHLLVGYLTDETEQFESPQYSNKRRSTRFNQLRTVLAHLGKTLVRNDQELQIRQIRDRVRSGVLERH